MKTDALAVLTDAARAVADGTNVTDSVGQVLAGSAAALGVPAAAVLVQTEGRLDLLASTSHQVTDLEIYQSQVHEGPCLEAIATQAEVRASGADSLAERWPKTGPAIVDAGYTAVHAIPLAWRGRCYGALNCFGRDADATATEPEAARLLAGAITLAIAGSVLSPDAISQGLDAALDQRTGVEQAKGALAEVRGISVADAYDALVQFARTEGMGVGSAAGVVLDRARAGTLR